jgi:proteasome lid subunit RPN8/RPN11
METPSPRIHVLSQENTTPPAPPNGRPQAAPTAAPPVFGPSAGLRQFRCDGESRRPGDCDIILTQSAYRRIEEHLTSDTSRELGGLLLGYEVHSPDAGCSTVFVAHVLPGLHTEGTPTRLVLSEDTWAEFNRVTDALSQHGLTLERVGWYHSHPGIAIFLSPWDLDVCTLFTRPTHLALVVDPVRDAGGFFVRGRDGFRTDSPQGFSEFCDLQSKSVVTWNNVTPVEAPPAAVPCAPPSPSPAPAPARMGGALAAVHGLALLVLSAAVGALAAWVLAIPQADPVPTRLLEQRLASQEHQLRSQGERLQQATQALAATAQRAADAEAALAPLAAELPLLRQRQAALEEADEAWRDGLRRALDALPKKRATRP